MNRFKPTADRLPLVTEDFNFIFSATKEALKGVLGALAARAVDGSGHPIPMILHGCAVTSGSTSYSITEGFISMSGEIFHVEAQTLSKASGDPVYMIIQSTYDSSGVDDNVTDTWEYRKAIMAISSTGAEYAVLLSSFKTFKEVLRANIQPVWTDVTSLFTWALPEGSEVSGHIYFGYDEVNYFLRGDATDGGSGAQWDGILATFNGSGSTEYPLAVLNTFKGLAVPCQQYDPVTNSLIFYGYIEFTSALTLKAHTATETGMGTILRFNGQLTVN